MSSDHAQSIEIKNPIPIKEAQQIVSLLNTVASQFKTLEETLRVQLMSNCDQVFHTNGTRVPEEVLRHYKSRQETLVLETLRRALGRFTSIKGALGGVDQILNKHT